MLLWQMLLWQMLLWQMLLRTVPLSLLLNPATANEVASCSNQLVLQVYSRGQVFVVGAPGPFCWLQALLQGGEDQRLFRTLLATVLCWPQSSLLLHDQ
jgi:hypothetical protein